MKKSLKRDLETDICCNCPYAEASLAGQYCEKVGGPNAWYGYCNDAEKITSTVINKNIVNVKNRKRAERRRRTEEYKKHHLVRLRNDGGRYGYLSVSIPIDAFGLYNSNEPIYYRRAYRSKLSKQLKRISNKKVRKYSGVLRNSMYKKLFDFWWSLT